MGSYTYGLEVPKVTPVLEKSSWYYKLDFGTFLNLEARLCVLGYMEGEGDPGYKLTAVLRGLFKARKRIAQRWQSVMPPSGE